MRLSSFILAFCLALAGLPSGAFGQGTVLILETAFEGDVSDVVKDRLRAVIHAGLSENTSNEVLTEEESAAVLGDQLDTLIACNLEASCLVAVGEATGADAAIGCGVSVAGEIYLFNIDVFDLNTGEALYYSDSDCPLCTVDEAEGTLSGMAREAGTAIPVAVIVEAPEEPPTEEPVVEEPIDESVTLFIRTQPDDARLFIDGTPVGVGVVDIAVEPGSHQMVVEAEGYETVSEEITVAAGDEDVVINVQMRESVTSVVTRSNGFVDRMDTTLAGSILVGTGVVALISGIVLLAIDGNTTCSSGSVDQCPEVYETTAGGAVLSILGTAALTSGTILLLWDRLAGRPSRVEQPATTGLDFSFGPDRAFLLYNSEF